MLNVLPVKCVDNILTHVMLSWNYGKPTGDSLEYAVYEGLKPFYVTATKLGSPGTIVDVGKDNQAFDIKGVNDLKHVDKLTKASNHNRNNYQLQQLVDGRQIYVKIPKSITTFVRRPGVNTQNYKGNPKTIIEKQIADYKKFAEETTKKDGYDELYSLVMIYGEKKEVGIRSIYLSLNKFEIPEIVDYRVCTNKDNKPCAYEAVDANNETVFKLNSMNAGSSNFSKRFNTSAGFLVTWATEERKNPIWGRDNYLKNCTITEVDGGHEEK